jgi:hypothetical protein
VERASFGTSLDRGRIGCLDASRGRSHVNKTEKENIMSEKQKPAFKVTHGRVSCAVWENKGGEGVFHTVTMERSYKDGEQYKSTNSFGITSDLDALERCLFDVKVWQAMQSQR